MKKGGAKMANIQKDILFGHFIKGSELLFIALQSLVRKPLCFAGSEEVGKGFLHGGGAIQFNFLHNT